MATRTLTEADWRRVFSIRCQTKQGHSVSDDDAKLAATAYRADPKRYAAMTADVFDATKPFGAK